MYTILTILVVGLVAWFAYRAIKAKDDFEQLEAQHDSCCDPVCTQDTTSCCEPAPAPAPEPVQPPPAEAVSAVEEAPKKPARKRAVKKASKKEA